LGELERWEKVRRKLGVWSVLISSGYPEEAFVGDGKGMRIAATAGFKLCSDSSTASLFKETTLSSGERVQRG
jgi:hypothetical protein